MASWFRSTDDCDTKSSMDMIRCSLEGMNSSGYPVDRGPSKFWDSTVLKGVSLNLSLLLFSYSVPS